MGIDLDEGRIREKLAGYMADATVVRGTREMVSDRFLEIEGAVAGGA